MSMRRNSRNSVADREDVIAWARSLTEESLRCGTIVVVEGRRDVKALVQLGVRAIFTTVGDLEREIRLRGPDAVAGRHYVILTDFDSEGNKLRRRLERELSEMGAVIIRWPAREYRKLRLPDRIEEAKIR